MESPRRCMSLIAIGSPGKMILRRQNTGANTAKVCARFFTTISRHEKSRTTLVRLRIGDYCGLKIRRNRGVFAVAAGFDAVDRLADCFAVGFVLSVRAAVIVER